MKCRGLYWCKCWWGLGDWRICVLMYRVYLFFDWKIRMWLYGLIYLFELWLMVKFWLFIEWICVIWMYFLLCRVLWWIIRICFMFWMYWLLKFKRCWILYFWLFIWLWLVFRILNSCVCLLYWMLIVIYCVVEWFMCWLFD